MRMRKKKTAYMGICFLAAFALWTAAVQTVDRNAIGPCGSIVGFSAVNQWFHALTGVNMTLYRVTDWLSVIPICFVAGFACLGLIQWVRRKHLAQVDHSILVLGVFYVAVMAVYMLFEILALNFRPVLIDGILEASYPSSTTVLVLCIMSTAVMQLRSRIRNRMIRTCITVSLSVFTGFMVIGRLLSGVHWFTDIVGGILISAALVTLYHSFCHQA